MDIFGHTTRWVEGYVYLSKKASERMLKDINESGRGPILAETCWARKEQIRKRKLRVFYWDYMTYITREKGYEMWLYDIIRDISREYKGRAHWEIETRTTFGDRTKEKIMAYNLTDGYIVVSKKTAKKMLNTIDLINPRGQKEIRLRTSTGRVSFGHKQIRGRSIGPLVHNLGKELTLYNKKRLESIKEAIIKRWKGRAHIETDILTRGTYEEVFGG